MYWHAIKASNQPTNQQNLTCSIFTLKIIRGMLSKTIIIVDNGIDDSSSNPEGDWLYFTSC